MKTRIGALGAVGALGISIETADTLTCAVRATAALAEATSKVASPVLLTGKEASTLTESALLEE
eukprot:6173465-Pleurochrysis_carterae.AAC.6